MKLEIDDIKKVRLDRGDIVVISFNQHLTSEQKAYTVSSLRISFPENEVVVLDGSTTIDLITMDQLND